MKTTYGGTEIETSAIVWVFDTWAKTPIYHAGELAEIDGGPHDGLHAISTRCGLWVDSVHRDNYKSAIHIAPRHAIKFARPCLTCWPELRRQKALPLFAPQVRRQNRKPEPIDA